MISRPLHHCRAPSLGYGPALVPETRPGDHPAIHPPTGGDSIHKSRILNRRDIRLLSPLARRLRLQSRTWCGRGLDPELPPARRCDSILAFVGCLHEEATVAVQKVCQACGSEFLVKQARAASARWCSKECRRNQVQKVCNCCRRGFGVPNRRSDEVKFCSLACKTEAGWLLHSCCVCGAAVRRKRSDNAGSKHIYCSRACYFKASLGRPKNTEHRPPSRLSRVCRTCGTSFIIPRTRIDTAKWCSGKCMAASVEHREAMSVSQSGDKHWRWAGGLYKHRTGYIRHKQKLLGVETVKMPHREVLLAALMKADPTHAFIEGNRLSSKIEVHHIDRDRANNTLPNLLAVTKAAHARIHHQNQKPMPGECWPSNPPCW